MSTRKQKVLIFIVTLLIMVFGCFKKSNGLKQHDIKPLIFKFLSRHVQYNELNDEISKRTMDNYIRLIDPGKYYFYKSDIEKFLINEEEIDDNIASENYKFIFDIFNQYKARFTENMKLFDQLLTNKYDFKKDETIIIDSEKIDFPSNKNEMKERWRKNIKLQLLNYINIVKDIKQAKEKLKKKYYLQKKHIFEFNEEKIISIFINAFSTALDPHSNYLEQEDHEDFMISTKLKFEGIGALLRSEDGFVIVESIIPGGAASKLPESIDLKPNDKIIAVAQGENEPLDVIDMELREVVKLIRGKKDTVVKLTIMREDVDTHKQVRLVIPIKREEIKLEDRAAKSEIYTIKRNGKDLKIGYIKLPSFYRDFDAMNQNDPEAKSSVTDVINLINSFSQTTIHAIVVDLRGNPGGSLDEAINLSGLFIDKGPIVQIKTKNDIDVYSDKIPDVYYQGPVVVLVDKFSASASEIFAGAIKDYKRGIIIGSTSTFGKGSVQSYEELSDKKGAIKTTTALFYQPAGSSNQLNGIYPNLIVPDLSSIWEIGENELKYALKWKKIPSSDFTAYKNYLNKKIILSLSQESGKRMKNNKKFNELIEKIKKFKKQLSNKEISLKDESRIEDQKLKDLKDKIRKEKKDKLIDLDNDIFLLEAFNITADYILLLK